MNHSIFGILLLLALFNVAASVPVNATDSKGTVKTEHESIPPIVNSPPSMAVASIDATTTTSPIIPVTNTTLASTTQASSTSATPASISTTPSLASSTTTMLSTSVKPKPVITSPSTGSAKTASTTVNPTPAPPSVITSPEPNMSSVPVDPVTPVKGRHFDGLSFMGGIILMACLVGLSVGSYKFYKIRTEESYHTL